MGDVNPIHTLGGYSKPSHEGYRNTIELPVWNNMVPLRSDTIRLVQNGCSFHRLWSEDPNQHLKDFLKLVDSLDLDSENRERTRLCLFQFSLRDQASNWLKRLPAGSITIWEDLATHFLAQFFPPGRTAKLRNDILMFQQHQGESLSEAWTRFKDLLQKSLIMASIKRPKNPSIIRGPSLYDNKSWNEPRDFAKPVKAIYLPQDVPIHSTAASSSSKINGPHDTQYCMENPEQAFVEYASSRIDEAGGRYPKQQQSEMTNKIDIELKAITDRIAGALPRDTVKNPKLSINSTSLVLSARFYPTEDPQCSTYTHGSINTITIYPKQQSNYHDDKPERNEEEEKERPENIDTNPSTPHDPSSSSTEFVCTKGDDGAVMFIEIVKKGDDSRKEEPEAGRLAMEYFDTFPTRSELAYPKYLICGPIPLIFLRNPFITEGCPSNLKIPCNIRHVHVENACIDLNSPLNIMTRMMYNWIMRKKLDPKENLNRGVSNFTGRIKGMHIFIGNFTYITEFMIVKDISPIIDPRLSQVVVGKPFIEISNMTHDPPEGVVRFTNGTSEVSYKMLQKIEQYNSLSDLKKEHTKSVYLRNEEDKRRGVEYVMSKILVFYKECLELGPEYATGMDDKGEVTLYLIRRSLEVLRKFHWMILGGRFNQLSHVFSPLLSKPWEY
ncbi:retrotransposon ORF1 [Tanacetum coccineum]